MSLWSDFMTNQQRVIDKWKHYFPIYERHFGKFVNTDVTFIEIGCGEGGSLQMWKRFFGPRARIVGIDINPACTDFKEDQIAICIGDQADPEFLKKVVCEFGPPDVVLDDGSHIMSQVQAAFAVLYPELSRNGVYLVEDLHTAYWDSYEGGLKREGTFIETCKGLIDQLNAGALFHEQNVDPSRGSLHPTPFTLSTLSMHFYESVVVFEKARRHTRNAPVRSGVPNPRATAPTLSRS